MTLEFVRTEPGDDPIIVEGYFAATPARVLQAWADPNIVMKWFGPAPISLLSATIDLRPGGAWQFLKSKEEEKSFGFEGEYLDIEPGMCLVFTWCQVITHASGEREATPHSQVQIIFTAMSSGSYIRLVHSAVHGEDARRGFGGGWEFAFNALSALIFGSWCPARNRCLIRN